jgi:hypothetical protein
MLDKQLATGSPHQIWSIAMVVNGMHARVSIPLAGVRVVRIWLTKL